MNSKPDADKNARDDAPEVTDQDRTMTGRPSDPNRMGAGFQIPPGVDPEDVKDPGRATPDAPPVDNRS